jgi:hypothetical protein
MRNYDFFTETSLNVMDSVEFKLSTCFEITDVRHSNLCTFFKIKSKAKDVTFNPEPLKKAIGMRKASSGYFYLVGHWDFIGIEGVDCMAIRLDE